MKLNLTSIIVLLVLIFALPVHGQKKQKKNDTIKSNVQYKTAIRHFKLGYYEQAKNSFNLLYEEGFRDINLIEYLADSYLELGQYQEANDVIQDSEQLNQYLQLLLAQVNYKLEKFDEALNYLTNIDGVEDVDHEIIEELRQTILNGKQTYESPKSVLVQNFGPEVNTKYEEYASVMQWHTFDQLLFTTSQCDTTDSEGHDVFHETIHKTTIDSLNKWHVSDPFQIHHSHDHEEGHDATVQIYDEGRKMITYQDGKLYTSQLIDSVWEESPLIIHDYDYGYDTHCYINDDENFIIFASDYHSNGADLDLFVAYKEDSLWSEPQNISELNSEMNEDAPFIADDRTIYFSSQGHNSLGGYDVFRSTYDLERGRWTEPENLGYPINTVSNDTYFTIFGNVSFLSSDRKGGYGAMDLYKVLMFNKLLVHGIVEDDSKNPIVNTKVSIKYDSIGIESYTDGEGKYEMFMPVNKKFTFSVQNDSVTFADEEYYMDAFFRVKEDREYNFQVSSTASQITEPKLIHIELADSFRENPALASIPYHAVEEWADSLNEVYHRRSKLAASGITKYSKPKGAALVSTLNVVPTDSPINDANSRGLFSVFFDLNSYQLDNNSRMILKFLYDYVLKNAKFKVNVSGYTDVSGRQSYNKELSMKRAKTVANYLIELGYDKKYLIIDGFGEGKSKTSDVKDRRVDVSF